MNCYRYIGHHERIFVGLPITPTTFAMRNGQILDAPHGSPVVLAPGDFLVTWEDVPHALLELTDEHPFAPRPKKPRSRPARRPRTEEK